MLKLRRRDFLKLTGLVAILAPHLVRNPLEAKRVTARFMVNPAWVTAPYEETFLFADPVVSGMILPKAEALGSVPMVAQATIKKPVGQGYDAAEQLTGQPLYPRRFVMEDGQLTEVMPFAWVDENGCDVTKLVFKSPQAAMSKARLLPTNDLARDVWQASPFNV